MRARSSMPPLTFDHGIELDAIVDHRASSLGPEAADEILYEGSDPECDDPGLELAVPKRYLAVVPDSRLDLTGPIQEHGCLGIPFDLGICLLDDDIGDHLR